MKIQLIIYKPIFQEVLISFLSFSYSSELDCLACSLTHLRTEGLCSQFLSCHIAPRMIMARILIQVLLILFAHIGAALIAYDCRHRNTQVQTISLTEIAACPSYNTQLTTATHTIQLVQARQFESVKFIQCKIEVIKTYFGCGQDSHIYGKTIPISTEIITVDHAKCKSMHRTGMYEVVAGKFLYSLKVNATYEATQSLAGWMNADGRCGGAGYIMPYGGFASHMVVHGAFKFTLLEGYADVDRKSNKIRLPSGTTCSYKDKTCTDIMGGNTFWSPYPKIEKCGQESYDVLYEGTATLLTSPVDEGRSDDLSGRSLMTIQTKDIIFAIGLLDHSPVCHQEAYRTEHPQLFVIFRPNVGTFALRRGEVLVSNINLASYYNSKFVYVERHIRTQLQDLWIKTKTITCENKRADLGTLLTLAYVNEEEFAYNFMQAPGYNALVRGEVVHLLSCAPVEVVRQSTSSRCYQELPVEYSNTTWFMAPRSHILRRVGTEVECSELTPPLFQLRGDWYNIHKNFVKVKTPVLLDPSSNITWVYHEPGDLVNAGLYKTEDLEALQKKMMFSGERAAITNYVIRTVDGNDVDLQGGSMHGFLDSLTLDKITGGTWENIANKMSIFGRWSSIFVTVTIIFMLAKFVGGVFIRFFAMRRLLGFGAHLFGAIWGTLATAIIHSAKFIRGETATSSENHPLNKTDVVLEIEPDPPVSAMPLISQAHDPSPSAPEVSMLPRNPMYPMIPPL
nr:MAG: putative glycoprotein [Wufeng shrew chuvirus 1]